MKFTHKFILACLLSGGLFYNVSGFAADLFPEIATIGVNHMNDAVIKHCQVPFTDDYSHNIWATVFHEKTRSGDLVFLGMPGRYDSTHDTIVIGSDLVIKSNSRAGIAFNFTDCESDLASSEDTFKNNTKQYGVTLYARQDLSSSAAVIADFSYAYNDNEAKLDMTSTATTSTADTTTEVYSAGVRLQRTINISDCSALTPYAGVRIYRYAPKDYTDNNKLEYSPDGTTMFAPRVGFLLTSEYGVRDDNEDTDGWVCRPALELGYIWNCGNRECSLITRNPVTETSDTTNFALDDAGYYFGKVAFVFERSNFQLGVDYLYQKSSHLRNNRYGFDAKVFF